MDPLLLNVVSLSAIESKRLENATLAHGAGVFLNYWRDFAKLPLVGMAKCEVASKVEGKNRLFTTTLTAKLSEHFDVRGRNLSFLVGCANGDRYLVGLAGRPHPTVNTADIMPDSAADRSGCDLSVELTDSIGLIKVLD